MNVRLPHRAGSFYQASPEKCREDAEAMVREVGLPDDLPKDLRGGIVPHAGWTYSGSLAVRTLKALCSDRKPETFILFGADHSGTVRQGEVFDRGAWRTPLGEAAIDEELAEKIIAAGPSLRANTEVHAYEHSIEVQVPLIQVAAEGARIVPIAVPPAALAVEVGKTVGNVLAGEKSATVVVGSTDLTHHGGHFGSPHGRGKTGEEWSRQNDRRMLNLIEAMKADEVVPEAGRRMNACGAGAIAATIAACGQLGATRGVCLEYTNSYEIVHAVQPDYADDTTVGYASVVFA